VTMVEPATGLGREAQPRRGYSPMVAPVEDPTPKAGLSLLPRTRNPSVWGIQGN
jgi:hypothetical protein